MLVSIPNPINSNIIPESFALLEKWVNPQKHPTDWSICLPGYPELKETAIKAAGIAGGMIAGALTVNETSGALMGARVGAVAAALATFRDVILIRDVVDHMFKHPPPYGAHTPHRTQRRMMDEYCFEMLKIGAGMAIGSAIGIAGLAATLELPTIQSPQLWIASSALALPLATKISHFLYNLPQIFRSNSEWVQEESNMARGVLIGSMKVVTGAATGAIAGIVAAKLV